MATVTETSSQLRRRTGILGRLTSRSGSGIPSPIAHRSPEHSPERDMSTSPSRERVVSGSSDDDATDLSAEEGEEGALREPALDAGDLAHVLLNEQHVAAAKGLDMEEETEDEPDDEGTSVNGNRNSPRAVAPSAVQEIRSKSWWEFDLAVTTALVSPIGNWLTGGDHIKNILLVLLMVFYLHQVIEVPWTLYQKSRLRRRAIPPSVSTPLPDERTRRLATSELRTLELAYLLLSVLSPIGGALLLHWAFSHVSETKNISWFSTGLFILATGIRPWGHFIERLHERTTDLQNAVHYPPPTQSTVSAEQIDALIKRIASLEREVKHLKKDVAGVSDVQELYDHVDEAIDTMEKRLRHQERKAEAARTAQETQIANLQVNVATKVDSIAARTSANTAAAQAMPPSASDWLPPNGVLHNLYSTLFGSSPSKPTSPKSTRRPHRTRSSPQIRLETIPEDGDAVIVSPSSPLSPLSPSSSAKSILSDDDHSPLLPPDSSPLVRLYYLATLPLRIPIRILRSANHYIVHSLSAST